MDPSDSATTSEPVPAVVRRRKKLRRFAIFLAATALSAALAEQFWVIYRRADFRKPLSTNYYRQTFHGRSPLRMLSEIVHFMPHSNPDHWGTDHGYKEFLCHDGQRVVETSRYAQIAAAVRPDEAYYAYFPVDSPRLLKVIEVGVGKTVMQLEVLSEEQVANGNAMVKWMAPGHIEVQEYVVVNSAVMPPKVLRKLTFPPDPGS